MSSGEKQIIVNPLERAVSTDIMRGQSFIAAAFNQFMQALLDNGAGTDDVQAGALSVPNTSAGTPSSGQVISGLLFSPVNASASASVGAGVAMIYDPDATPNTDDSQYKFIQDPGTVTPSLALTANASGSLRLDIVECARVQPDSILETDSRDIFNTVTGLFAAATVNKVSQAQLQYRIRTGTPGGGFPGGATGWMPLAVASVPTGTTTWDTVTLWDVRALLEDRIFSMTKASRDLPLVTRCYAGIDANNGLGGATAALWGNIEAQLGDRRVGGVMMPSTPATLGPDTLVIDIDDAQNQSASGAISTSGFNYVYICTPFGLPRWAKYTQTGTRVPRSPRGIVLCSNQVPNLSYGTPAAALSLPPCLQNTGNTATDLRAICVLARIGTRSGTDGPSTLVACGGVHNTNQSTPTNTATSVAGHQSAFTLVAGVDFPPHSRAIYVTVTGEIVTSGNVTKASFSSGAMAIGPTLPSLAIAQVAGGTEGVSVSILGGTNYQADTVFLTAMFRIPIPPQYERLGVPGTTPPGSAASLALTWNPQVTWPGGTWAMVGGQSTLVVQGWELLDAD